MTTQLNTVAAILSSVMSAILGSRVFIFIGEVVTEELPMWIRYILGPVGALVGMLFAIRWLAGRLDKQEQKLDAKEAERDSDRKALMAILEHTNTILNKTNVSLDANTIVLENTRRVVDGCHTVRMQQQK